MSTLPIKETTKDHIKDIEDSKNIADTWRWLPKRIDPPWPDPIGPRKLDAIDWLVQSYLHVVPQIDRRLEAIESHLEDPEGTPFIRSQERPDVGGEALQQLSESIRHLNQRLDKIEKQLD